MALRNWKLASTVMLAARRATPSISSHYQVLMLGRSGQSKFMPNAHVFPGGIVSQSDYSADWLDIYSSAGYVDLLSSLPRVKQNPSERPPMMTNECGQGTLINDIALRICAIRETFEEAGILLVKPDKFDFKGNKSKLNQWRKRVYEDASRFTECCTDLGVIPDIWSLYEWSNWLTPNHMPDMHSNKRYDTAFYIACLPKPPPAIHDDQEIVHSHWDSPGAVLKKYHDKSLWLAPPQIYEIARLQNYTLYEDLQKFAEGRNMKGCERWLPVRVSCDDGVIALLPGDSLYPRDVDTDGKHPAPVANGTVDSIRASSEFCHRFEIKGPFDCQLRCNVSQKHGHASPLVTS